MAHTLSCDLLFIIYGMSVPVHIELPYLNFTGEMAAIVGMYFAHALLPRSLTVSKFLW